MKCKKKYVLFVRNISGRCGIKYDRFYRGMEGFKVMYDEPGWTFSIKEAKKMSPQGCSIAMKMLVNYGYEVERMEYNELIG